MGQFVSLLLHMKDRTRNITLIGMEWLPCVKLVNSSYVLFSTFTSPLGHTEFAVPSDYFLSPDKTSKTHKGGRRIKPIRLSKLEKEFIVSRV